MGSRITRPLVTLCPYVAATTLDTALSFSSFCREMNEPGLGQLVLQSAFEEAVDAVPRLNDADLDCVEPLVQECRDVLASISLVATEGEEHHGARSVASRC